MIKLSKIICGILLTLMMNKLIDYLLIFNQIIIRLTTKIWAKLYGVEIGCSSLNIDPNKKYIIVANHVSKADAFLIPSLLPLHMQLKLWPYRFIIAEKYLVNKYSRLFFYWCGCFSGNIKRNKGKKALDLMQEFIDSSQTLVIFPEAKINKLKFRDKRIVLGIGPIYLEKNNSNLYLLPVKISHSKKSIKIGYGKPFRHEKFPKNFKPLIEETMDGIYNDQ